MVDILAETFSTRWKMYGARFIFWAARLIIAWESHDPVDGIVQGAGRHYYDIDGGFTGAVKFGPGPPKTIWGLF
jgi:hypothetical protein